MENPIPFDEFLARLKIGVAESLIADRHSAEAADSLAAEVVELNKDYLRDKYKQCKVGEVSMKKIQALLCDLARPQKKRIVRGAGLIRALPNQRQAVVFKEQNFLVRLLNRPRDKKGKLYLEKGKHHMY